MRFRVTGLVVLLALAAGVFFGWPLVQGYLGARQERVPPAPVQTLDKPPPAAGQVTPKEATPGKPEQGQQTVPPSSAESQSSTSGNNTPVPPVTGGESEIDKEYLAQLNQIGQYYQGQLNALVSQAYSAYQAAGKSNTSLRSLAGQYIGKGLALENQSDEQFYSELDQYQAALGKAGEPLTYEEQAKAQYEATKAAERGKILSAAEQYLK